MSLQDESAAGMGVTRYELGPDGSVGDATVPDAVAAKLSIQITVLERALAGSTMALYSGRLRSMIREARAARKAWVQAEGDEIEGAELLAAAVLSNGVRVYWPDLGVCTVVRTANGMTGILLNVADFDPTMSNGQEWVNVDGPASPVVVVP